MSLQESFRKKLRDRFSKAEIQTLCFDLGFDFENLDDRSIQQMIEALILTAIRQQKTEELVAYLRKTRPKEIWPDPSELESVEWVSTMEEMPRDRDMYQVGDVGEGAAVAQGPNAWALSAIFNIPAKSVWSIFGIIATLGIAGVSALWYSDQPSHMEGDFNIAVAEFVQVGEEDDIQVAQTVSQRIFSQLDVEYKESSFDIVEVEHDKMGRVNSAEQAKDLAEKVNADLVIYGTVTSFGDQILISPRFYAVGQHLQDVNEITGEQKLEASISLSRKDLTSESAESLQRLQLSNTVLIEFTKAIVFRAAGQPIDYKLGRDSIETVIDASEKLGPFEGKEILFLYASDIARRQEDIKASEDFIKEALSLNIENGRIYIGLGNIEYDKRNLHQAINIYKEAATLENQPYGSFVLEKAHNGIGNVCNLQFQSVIRNVQSVDADVINLANCALDSYRIVIDSFLLTTDPPFILKNMATSAYYNSGIIYQETGNNSLAQQFFEKTISLSDDARLIDKATIRLAEVSKDDDLHKN